MDGWNSVVECFVPTLPSDILLMFFLRCTTQPGPIFPQNLRFWDAPDLPLTLKDVLDGYCPKYRRPPSLKPAV